MQLCPGCDLCQNGGICQSGPASFTCVCLDGYSGQNCATQTSFSCSPGTALSSGGCQLCSPGTYSTDGAACVPCQKGTASNATAVSDSCAPCLWHLRTLHQRHCVYFVPVMQPNGQFHTECLLSSSTEGKSDQHNSRGQYRRNSNTCFWLGLCWGSCWLDASF